MQYTGFYNDSFIADRYRRLDLTGDVLYHTYRFGPMTILFPKQNNTVTVFTDTHARQMAEQGIITNDALRAYEDAVCAMYPTADSNQELGVLQTYHLLCRLRRQILGTEALEQAREMDRGQTVSPATQSICEDAKKEELLQTADTAMFLLYDAQYFAQMRQDMEKAGAAGHRICLVVSPELGDRLPAQQTLRSWLGEVNVDYLESADGDLETVQWDSRLQADLDTRRAAVFAYGEEALLVCRSLRVDAVVTARPQGHCTRALINQLGCDTQCTVFVPKNLDITEFVPLTEKTRLSYWHLAMLRRDAGEDIDRLSIEQLYRRYPAYFLNRYENGAACATAEPGYPISVKIPEEDTDPVGNFEVYREAAIADYINSFEDVAYRCAYFDEEGNQISVPWNADKQKGILVNTVRVKRAKGSGVIACGSGVTLRQRLQNEGTGIVSNFLFFLTSKLAALYNNLRQDRPYEQAQLAGQHLDYMLETEDGVRRETFPLFRKTCIGMKENGEFLFFNFRLGGGKVRIGSQEICWGKADVDPEEPKSVCVYTPCASIPDGDADRQTYRKPVGQGRVNLVFLQDRLHCVRSGDVILPSVGVVISLEKAQGDALLNALQLRELGDGYYDPGQQTTEIRLDPPEEVSPEEWAQLRWAYGGGLSLILEHKAVTDREDMLPWFEAEGWMSPLSRQTQESTLHTLVKHPRTAIGVADNGDLLILVFSGRTRISTGADYKEMCHIARTLYPDVRTLMNADGGGSAVLGLVCRGSFMELSYPSTSTGSTVGMARPIQTAFYIPQEEKEK